MPFLICKCVYALNKSTDLHYKQWVSHITPQSFSRGPSVARILIQVRNISNWKTLAYLKPLEVK